MTEELLCQEAQISAPEQVSYRNEDSLDTRLSDSEQSEMRFSDKDCVDLVVLAGLLQAIDATKNDKRLQELLEVDLNLEGNRNTVQNIYSIARDMGVSQEYIDKAISTHKPSIEEQLSDLEKHGVVPSIDVITHAYVN
ncbi:MAG: hypothetical protein V1729_05970, partial [Candidatus Woesearchaeota archaeon]